nr:hypothetical protein [uncultured Mediterraneibacter sp.]
MFDYEPNHKYAYDGPVLAFDKIVSERWRGETMAPTKKKAKSNLTYQFKKQNNRLPGTRITLPGEIKMVN